MDLNGPFFSRYAMITCALAAPIPFSPPSSPADAVLTLISFSSADAAGTRAASHRHATSKPANMDNRLRIINDLLLYPSRWGGNRAVRTEEEICARTIHTSLQY